MPRATVLLRPATEADLEFLWTVQWEALGTYVTAVFGTDQSEQRRFFDERFDVTRHRIVAVGPADAGFVSWEQKDDHVYLANLALLPPFQRRGIGGAIITSVLDEARAAGLPVRLQVLNGNPARRFYERHGFVVSGRTPTHTLMERQVPKALS